MALTLRSASICCSILLVVTGTAAQRGISFVHSGSRRLSQTSLAPASSTSLFTGCTGGVYPVPYGSSGYGLGSPNLVTAQGKQVSYCCPNATYIRQWQLQPVTFGPTNSKKGTYLAAMSAACTDGSGKLTVQLPKIQIIAGAGCDNSSKSLGNTQPINDKYGIGTIITANAGDWVDTFLNVGSSSPTSPSSSFSCKGAFDVPVGFAAQSTCYALSELQVICAPMNTARPLATFSPPLPRSPPVPPSSTTPSPPPNNPTPTQPACNPCDAAGKCFSTINCPSTSANAVNSFAGLTPIPLNIG